jgi:alpha-mannosidase
MHRIKTEQNINRIKSFQNRIGKEILKDEIPVSAEYSHSVEPVSFQDRQKGVFREIKVGETWGETWDSAWFHIKAHIPSEWKNENIAFHLDFNGESLIFDDEGIPLYGLTNGSVFDKDYSKDVYRLPAVYSGGNSVDLWIEAAANHLFGIDLDKDPEKNDLKRHGEYSGIVNQMGLCRFDESLWHLWLDVQVLSDLISYLPENTPRRNKIIHRLCSMIDLYCEDSLQSGQCREFLKELWTSANCSDLTVTGIGHAHIDTGWLWPVKETIRKCARTFASQIDLIERYPDYIFGASQPQHYQFVKDYYPALYKKIKQLVKEGRWEIQGGMWVEADCNVISGESMVRQFLHGKNFFKDEFGVDVTNLWLPDVFGYSSAMPQILKKSGVDFFMTQKISWNQYNKFPFHLFNWKGIDGTEVVTHFLPENDYNSSVNAAKLCQAQDRFNENHISDEFVSLFGIGNGGGGPKEEYIERGLRLQNLEGAPKWKFGKAGDAFDRMKKLSPQLATWSGELYLELHRGTLTTQALTKKYNRLIETRLRALEYLCSSLASENYPSEKLDQIWKNLLMNQFHDIIPGSSIRIVYETAHKEYEKMLNDVEQLFSETAELLFEKDENRLITVNILSCEYNAPVVLPEGWKGFRITDSNGNMIPLQLEEGKLITQLKIGATETVCLIKGEAYPVVSEITDSLILENDLIRYELDETGRILRAYDKEENREVLNNPGNILSLYVDRPQKWDAWDVDISYENMLVETAEAVKVTPLTFGPVRSGICFETKIGISTISQRAYLGKNSKKIDFETTVDWKERHKMLRTAFPVNVFSNEANCDIQYGYVKRPTHRNTSWDMAKYEVAAHKYVDLSDNGYGVALLNDCKYGYKIHENVLDLNLLRSPTNPDADADIHVHKFTYSFLPHRGTLVESSVMNDAAMMNNKALVFDGYTTDKILSPCLLSGSGVSLEVVKKGEKEDSRIIRLVEMEGRRNKIELSFHHKKGFLVETDLMEWKNEESVSCENPIELEFSPFEIKTFKIKS